MVAAGVRRITAPNPGPFTFHGTNSYIVGSDHVVVIDPGPDDPAHIEALLRAVGSAKVDAILATHSHRDHVPGTGPLREATGAPVLAGRLAVGPSREGEPDVRLDAPAASAFLPDRFLSDGEIIAGDGYRLEAIATPGHASDHFAFALSGRDILLPGDHVMGWATTVVAPPDGAMADYMRSLERLMARPQSTYLPAHGGEIGDAHAYMRGLRSHRRMRERAVLDRVRRGDRTIAEIVASTYAEVDPRLHGAAAMSTLAHLEDLVARGLVASEGPPTLGGSYREGRPAGTAGAGPAGGDADEAAASAKP